MRGPFTKLGQPPRSRDGSYDPFEFSKWVDRIWLILSGMPGIAWDIVDKVGSKLTDIVIRPHSDLQEIKTLDPTDTDTVQDKHLSNNQAKYWQDHVPRTDNPHNVTATQVGKDVAQWNADRIQGKAIATPGLPEDLLYIQWDNTAGHFVYASASGGAGGTPASSIVSETAFGQSSAVGIGSKYAREDHTHGTPADPLPAHASLTITAHGGIVASNGTITGATKTKITYDSKGLVTSGADATTADIADSANKRYVTEAQLVVLGNTSGVNTGDQVMSQVEVDFGSTPADEKVFTISDANITAASKIMAAMAYVATTDNDADEIDMSKISCAAGLPGTGSFSLSVFAADGPIAGKFKVNYSFA